MTIFLKKIREIKQKQDSDFARISFNKKQVVLRVVDKSEDTIQLLTQWRNEFWDAFPVKFISTIPGTRKWLKEQVYDKEDRILFLIILDGKKIGHIGTYRYDKKENSAEIDNVVRALRQNHPGLMEKVTKFLIHWMLDDLQLSKVKLKVFSDNHKAINLYERCGMLTVGIIPLKRKFTNNGWEWKEIMLKDEEYADRYFSIMEIKKSD